MSPIILTNRTSTHSHLDSCYMNSHCLLTMLVKYIERKNPCFWNAGLLTELDQAGSKMVNNPPNRFFFRGPRNHVGENPIFTQRTSGDGRKIHQTVLSPKSFQKNLVPIQCRSSCWCPAPDLIPASHHLPSGVTQPSAFRTTEGSNIGKSVTMCHTTYLI